MNCEVIPSATFLPELADGQLPCNLQDGPQIGQSGQALALVSHSPAQAKDSEIKTSDTSGLSSSISSASAALTQSLASKLQARLGTGGSMEYRQTWSQKVTPAGRPYWAHTASGHRISANVSTGWPTPTTSNHTEAGPHGEGGENLQTVAAMMSGWPTPVATDGAKAGNVSPRKGAMGLSETVSLAGWPTTMANNATKDCNRCREDFQNGLGAIAGIAGWATPTTRDHKNTGDLTNYIYGSPTGRIRTDSVSTQAYIAGEEQSGSHSAMGSKGALNPALAAWLMGYLPAWCDCAVTAMQSFLSVRKPSSKPSLTAKTSPPVPEPASAE